MKFTVDSIIDFQSDFDGFNNRYFLNTCADFFKLNLRYLIVKNKSEIVAIWPYFFKKKAGLNIVVKPLIQYYQPIVFLFEKRKRFNENEKIKKQILDSIAAFLQENYYFIETNLSPEIEDIRPFTSYKYRVQPLYTYLINLDENNYEEYHSSARKAIRKAFNNNMTFEEKFHLEKFIQLHHKTFERQKKKFPIDDESLLNLLKSLYENNLIRQFNIKYKKEIVASRLVVSDRINERVYDFLAVSNPELNSLGANSYLMFSMIETFKSEFKIFDLCGANIPKIAEFKSHFDSRLKTFFKINWTKFSL